ncbi:MAG TPA: hypothetical protein VFX30_11030 [bacterium]|nr:hypothetical protein [bacterium]
MKSSRPKKATGVLLAALALTLFGCGSGDKAGPEKQLVTSDGGGTRQVTATEGEGTGGTTAGDTTGGTESDDASGEPDPALIMHIINSTLN